MNEATIQEETTVEAGRVDPVVRPVAWLRKDGLKAITDDEKQAWIESGNMNIVEDYTMPLYEAESVDHKIIPLPVTHSMVKEAAAVTESTLADCWGV